MRVLHCRHAVVPIDKIASIYAVKPGWVILVRDVTGHNHHYAEPGSETKAAYQLDDLAAWLETDAPDTEP